MLKASADWHGNPLISCSWLVKPEAAALVPDCVAHLQKPDLHYDDFVAALKDAGFETAQDNSVRHRRNGSGGNAGVAPASTHSAPAA